METWVLVCLVSGGLLVALCAGLLLRNYRSRAQGGVTSRLTGVTAVWAGLAGTAMVAGAIVGMVVGGDADDAQVAAQQGGAETTGVETNELVSALEEQGIDVDGGIDPAEVEGALLQGASGAANGAHDHGQQPTFTQIEEMSDDELLPLFPEGTVTRDDLPALRQEIAQARDVALRLDTPDKAMAAGYVNTTSDVPFMGQHYLNYDLVRDGTFDPSHPEGLLFSKIDGGEEKLVGVWYLQVPGIGGVRRDVEPVGFSSDLDLWHAHTGLCLVGLSGASEGQTRDECEEKGGRFTADLRWMMHLWVSPETTENPAGIMAYLNNDLYEKQVAAKDAGVSADAPNGVTP